MTELLPPSARQRPLVSIVVVSKNEPALVDTLANLETQIEAVVPELVDEVELLVVDASTSERPRPPAEDRVRWIPYAPPPGVRVSIPHQRNVGVRAARGEIIVFTDCGCIPEKGWLAAILAPLLSQEERIACGHTGAFGALDPYSSERLRKRDDDYLPECSTINLGFRRSVFDELDGFDESFEYGSDVDFSWRAVHRGIRIRYVPDAVLLHDWGTRRRQIRRAFMYGKARARLYHKHVVGRGEQSVRKRWLNERDAVPLLYPAFILGLPLALRFPWYILLPLLTAWRARKERPLATVIDHLTFGLGVLAGAWDIARSR